MHDPIQTNRFIELTLKAVESHPKVFMRPGRDPSRIDGFLDKLREVWKRHPDLRFTQLVFNASGATQPCPEIFYLEDDALLQGLDSLESQGQSGES